MRKLLVVLLVFLGGAGVYLFFARGPVGRAVGLARTYAMPRDDGLLGFFPRETDAVAIVQLPFVQLPDHRKFKDWAEEARGEVRHKSGVDLMYDVDTVAVTEKLVVARGRYSWGELREKLGAEGFELSEDGDTPILHKKASGEGVALVRPYLVMGRLKEVQAALASKKGGDGLERDMRMTGLLEDGGWRNAVVAAWRSASERKGMVSALLEMEGLRTLHVEVLPLLGNYRTGAAAVLTTASAGRTYERTLKEARDGWVAELRKSGNKKQAELAAALEKADITFDEGDLTLELGVNLPIAAFGDGVEDGAQAQRSRLLGSLGLPGTATPPPAVTPDPSPVVPVQKNAQGDLADEEMLLLNSLARAVCDSRGPDCSLQLRSEMLNEAAALRLAGKSHDEIRKALNVTRVKKGGPKGITLVEASFGVNCGARSGNMNMKVSESCDGKTLCRFTTGKDDAPGAAADCAPILTIQWSCAGHNDVLANNATADSAGKASVTMLCDP
jgi:hypothetical protein